MAKADQNKAAPSYAEADPQAATQSDQQAREKVDEQAREPLDEPIQPTETTDSGDSGNSGDATDSGEAEDLAALPADQLLARLNDANAENVQMNAQMKDQLLRTRAEIENIRRRSQNEIVSARKFAIEGFAQELLGVKDSLEQAASVELEQGAGESVQKMKEGLALTLKQLDLAMARFAVAEVEAAPGVPFDPEHHQAISLTRSEDIEAGHIVSVMQKGFTLKERLLRPAMVVVADSDDGRDDPAKK